MSNHIECPLCKQKNTKFITRNLRFKKNADIYECLQCELVFLDQNSFKLPVGFYENEYHQSYLTHVEPDALNPQVYYEKMLKVSAPWANRFIKMLSGGETVLDMGCSTGHFMKMIEGKAGKVCGHDLNIKEVKYCRDELDLDVSSQPLEERFEKGTFDFITLVFVLEHIGNPVAFLRYLKPFLKPKGKILIVVPSITDPLVSFYEIPEFRSFYYCIEHLFYYNKKSISLLFDKSGLSGSVELAQEYPLTNHLNWAYRKRPSDSLAARKYVPDVSVEADIKSDSWEELWRGMDDVYRKFLVNNGYADRLWCLVG
jgi:2-polyprenyl-3-methyl-5-hydroxy-6-metoxy-1,4-benzoquinol methylase